MADTSSIELPLYRRSSFSRVKSALTDTRVVLISGPRQTGKTTLAKTFASSRRPFFTLDNSTTLNAARRDPVGFVRGLKTAIIDEVQRIPELLLAIKQSVDDDPHPGRFLLTGSANLMTLPRLADSLAGRMEVVPLLPLAQGEIRNTTSRFLQQAFAGVVPTASEMVLGDDLVTTVLSGGYPEALRRSSWNRRQDWYLDYVGAIVQRDIREIAQIEQLKQMPHLLRILAHHSGQLVNNSAIGAPLGMNHVTTQKYVGIFEQLFLFQTLPPWHSNALKRLTKTPKLHFLDSGLLAALCNLQPEKLRSDRTAFGPVLETFVLSELLKLSASTGDRYQFSHFRDKELNEVDIVIEDRRGQLIGVEVKSAATVSASDFRGLHRLAEATKGRFRLGLVLYDHDQVIPFGKQLFAAPISTLW